MALSVKRVRRVSRFRLTRGLRYLPHLLTFTNAMFGCAALMLVIKGFIMRAAVCVIGAAVMDTADGYMARRLHVADKFGAELDALCDAISFCCVPAVLLYAAFPASVWWWRASLMLYLCSGIFRLARFKLKRAYSSPVFMGLPTTMAAMFLMALIIHANYLTKFLPSKVFIPVYALLVIGVALLMISRLPYPSLKRDSRKAWLCGVTVLCSMLGVWRGYPVMLVATSAYLMTGFVQGIKVQARRLKALIF